MKHTVNPRCATRLVTGLLLVVLGVSAGCSSSVYGWQVRTHSTTPSATANQAILAQGSVAVLGALASPGFGGTEVSIDSVVAEVLMKVAPQTKLVDPKDVFSRINAQGLAEEYTKMRSDALQSHILNRDPLRRIGAAVGARYLFQPRLTSLTQTMTNRWSFLDVRISQTRSSILRFSLQLWDAENGELLWGSVAETELENEGVGQEPVYFDDAVRVTAGSLFADFQTGKKASTYSSLNHYIDKLVQVPQLDQRKE